MIGLYVLDKPAGLTSRDAVNRLQAQLPGQPRLGHTGTLDPLATGVLVVCVGVATRLADCIQAMPKSYRSRFRLGATSTTDDADGEITERDGITPIPALNIVEALSRFIGTIDQVPPAYSALKKDGVRAHQLARKGKSFELQSRPVRIDAIRLLAYEWPYLDVEIDCGKGTYIRSIARDLGEMLGCGGLVQTLRRTRIGPFVSEMAVCLDRPAEEYAKRLLPPVHAVDGWVKVRMPANDAERFRHGQAIDGYDRSLEGPVAIVSEDGMQLIGLARAEEGRICPSMVLRD